jgi:hypothetical protein
MATQRDSGAWNDDRSADIATHGVKRYSNLFRHERPGNLLLCGSFDREDRALEAAAFKRLGEMPLSVPAGPRQ